MHLLACVCAVPGRESLLFLGLSVRAMLQPGNAIYLRSPLRVSKKKGPQEVRDTSRGKELCSSAFVENLRKSSKYAPRVERVYFCAVSRVFFYLKHFASSRIGYSSKCNSKRKDMEPIIYLAERTGHLVFRNLFVFL